MKHQHGFTLIELIIVIVVLGILALVAAPRFINIQSDARTQTLNGVKGAIESASQLVFAKSAIAGITKVPNSASNSEVQINGVPVQTHLGYPDVNPYTKIDSDLSASPPTYGIDSFVDIDASQLNVTINSTTSEMRITFAGEDSATNNCYVSYFNANSSNTSTPTLFVISDGC
ncbi:type II secretion system protein [Ningiella sp. W23]|uniref:type II secretion system protein n=1 Tax=Ningiella sp. W23 TaxID=3023715 RepID=UPI0037575D84